jgi:hypothetical protein
METVSIILQLMDPNYNPIHAHAYTVPRSLEQQLQNSKENLKFVDIGVLEEDSSEWLLNVHHLRFLRKMEQ